MFALGLGKDLFATCSGAPDRGVCRILGCARSESRTGLVGRDQFQPRHRLERSGYSRWAP
jgi:hypothetical protein